MITDPIIAHFAMGVRRLVLFIILALLFALLLWYWLLTSQFGIPVEELITWLRLAWPPVEHKIAAVFLYGSLTIGTLLTTIIYLWIGKWWKKRAMVQQHRGARIDERDE